MVNTKDLLNLDKLMEQVNLHGMMEEYSKEIFKMDNYMAKEL